MDTCYLNLRTLEGLGNEMTLRFFVLKISGLTERMQLHQLAALSPAPAVAGGTASKCLVHCNMALGPLSFHGHSLRDEGIRLDLGEGLQLREAETQHHAPQRGLYEAAV